MANQKKRFHRTKIATIASALMLASANVNALGLGVLTVESNLDQPLRGVIDLRVNSGDDINSVRASIASRADFASFGIDYSDYLDNVQVRLDRGTGAARLVVDSSNVIIKEPFIHFLIRVDWAGGSFLREYTALIDPPVYAAETPKSYAKPVSVGSDQSYLTYDSNSVNTTVNSTPDVTPRRVTSSTSNSSRGGVSLRQSSYADEATYGPVEAGDSLSVIANELQAQFPDLSIYQIMQVLFEENPHAFINGNINGLVKGAILNLGDINRIRAVDVEDAKSFFSTQASDWGSVKPTAEVENLKLGQDRYNDTPDDLAGSLSGSLVDNFQVGASSDTESLISDSDTETNSGSAEVVVLRQQISELESSLSSSALENQELKERLSIMEGQLNDMNQLMKLNVADADLASLEDALAKKNIAEDLNSDAVTGAIVDTVDGSLDASNIIEDSAFVDTDAADTVEAASELLADNNINVEGLEVETTDAIAGTDVIEAPKPVEVKKPKPIITPVAEPTLLEKAQDILFGSGLWKVVAGIGVLLIGAFAALFIRRRRADEEFEISMLSIESNSESFDNADTSSLSRSMSASVTASTNENSANSADKETSFLTVYSDSDAVVQADEVDPIAEADVYIAYGRHEQAEEVLLDGVTNYPERTDIKHKLLVVYHKNNNAEGFERVAEELYSQRDSLAPDVWHDICNMGQEIDSSNPLFQLSPEDIVAAANAADAVENEALISGEELVEATPLTQPEADPERNSQFDVDIEDESIQLINFDEGRSEISELDEVEIDSLDLNVDEIPEADLDLDAVDVEVDSHQEITVEGDDIEINEIEINDTVLDVVESNLDEDSVLTIDFGDEDDDGDIDEDSVLSFDDVADVLYDGDDDSVIEINDTVIEIGDPDDDDFLVNDSVMIIDEEDGSIDLASAVVGASDDAIESDSVNLVSENLIDDIKFELDDEAEDDGFDLDELGEVSDLEIDDDHDELRTQFELAKVFADLGDEDGSSKILNDIIADPAAAEDLVAESKALLETLS